jgi:hypothetical protein
MKITSITQRTYFDVEVEGGEFDQYRTYGSGDNWEVLMGESWETCYSQEEELKNLFQEYIQGHLININ